MTLSLSSTVEKLVADQLASGRFADANEVLLDALQKQRELQQEEFEDDWPAIKEALDEIEAGDQGRPANEVFDELRQKFNL